MFATLLRKKRLTEEQLAQYFVNTIVAMVDDGFTDVAGLVNEDPEFLSPPNIESSNDTDFLMIVLTANISRASKFFASGQDKRVVNAILNNAAQAFDIDPKFLAVRINEYKKFMKRVNYPSKNMHYAMSKAFFHKYHLNPHQDDYFRKLNTPNPIFLKRLDEAMECFLWNWSEITEKYKVVER